MNESVLNFWQALATGSIGIIVTLVAFWVGIGRKIVSRDEISEMIKSESTYLQDKQFIMERLNSHKEDQKTVAMMLQRNTEVMH